jgi:hypothetical protein
MVLHTLAMDDPSLPSPTDGKAFPWILEHLLAYPGTYEISLRTMYTMNVTTQNQQQHNVSRPPIPGNAFHRPRTGSRDEPHYSTAVAAAHLRANLMSHISKQPSQPISLPPSFITSFVRQTFGLQLDQVDFLQALTSLDYLRDLDIRRRREVLAALDKLGVDRSDLGQERKLAKKYPGVVKWIVDIEEKERRVEQVYTQVYIGLRRWTMLNELSIVPYNKTNCIAMLNTLYPPPLPDSPPIAQPTAQITPQILAVQRSGFFRYINAVEQSGKGILKSVYEQNKNPDDESGYTRLRNYLDQYLRMTTSIIDECYEITGDHSAKPSPTTSSFNSTTAEDARRKVDSGISFGTANSSNRNSAGSHATRPSTSSSLSTHSRTNSTQKQLPEKPLPAPNDEEDNDPTPVKPAGTKLERIARELRRIRSRGNIRSQSRFRHSAPVVAEDEPMPDVPTPPQTPVKDRTLRFKRSLRNIRGLSDGVLREKDGNSRPATASGAGISSGRSSVEELSSPGKAVPAFDVEQMKAKRLEWEAKSRQGSVSGSLEFVEAS